jgi:superfamily II DNA or RNA helicase
VDVPRLRVGVYATSARTELFFRQVVGRFVRRTPRPREQMSHVFLPADPRLKALAATIEEERAHALRLEPAGEAPAIERSAPAEAEPWHAVWSSARAEDDVLQTTQPGEALQLFAEAAPTLPAPAAPELAPVPSAHGRRERLRDERRALVAAISRRTGEPHRAIHARVNRATGAPSVSDATAEQLERGNGLLEREAR